MYGTGFQGVLMLYGQSTGPTPLYTLAIDGLDSTDPAWVSVSAFGAKPGVYTVGALIGFTTVVIDFDVASKSQIVTSLPLFHNGAFKS